MVIYHLRMHRRNQSVKTVTHSCWNSSYGCVMTLKDVHTVVAANVRARLAWRELSGSTAAAHLGMSQQAMSNKLRAVTPFSTDQLVRLAELVGLEDPGPFFRIPEGFPPPISEESESAWTRIIGLVA